MDEENRQRLFFAAHTIVQRLLSVALAPRRERLASAAAKVGARMGPLREQDLCLDSQVPQDERRTWPRREALLAHYLPPQGDNAEPELLTPKRESSS